MTVTPESPPEYGDLLVGIERVAARVPDGINTQDEIALAWEMIAEASEEVRAHGRPWTSVDVPAGIILIVAKAAARGYMNPSGYLEESADSAGLKRDRDYAKGASLTPDEVRRVKVIASRSGLTHVQASKPASWQPRSLANPDAKTFYAPVDGDWEEWFPWQSARVW